MRQEQLETNSHQFLIYFLEKEYDDCFIKSDTKKEKEEFFKKMENLQLIENQRLMNKTYIIFKLYQENFESMIALLEEKEKNEFYSLLFYTWRIQYGTYNEHIEEKINSIESKEKYYILISKLHNMLEDIEDKILSTPITDDELNDLNDNFDQKRLFKIIYN